MGGPQTYTPVLPQGIVACIFDLDGVITQTAKVHIKAWKETLDRFLRDYSEQTGREFSPFLLPDDYALYIDGKLRQDGVRSFLESRGISLPEGSPDDAPAAGTVNGIGNRKNDLLLDLIARDGVEVFESSVRYVEAVRALNVRRGVVSASKNTQAVLQAAGLEHLFEVRVDGLVAERDQLRGKPAPDMFLAAARELGVQPARTAVFEDADAGVRAGRAGGFGWVVGVDRLGRADALRELGADRVVRDLAELLERR